MARGTSQSQSSSAGAGGSRPMTVGPRGSAAATAGMRRRRTAGGGGAGGFSGGAGGGSNMLRFYTDDAPGLKMTPTVVLVMSLCFIGFVTALHVFGKLYRYRSAASGGS
ncbi:Protein transport protein Sec61 subunit beta [Rhynchospora pubera]|uniref:Protein transport protein Sec61 subunit beta n=1 Tax=Rhynchospora pubera TaxID=906938 RepID=A0AAV8FQZ2_9POAL|nr:Protein transport protein Sec61 subunit beta [Rhynchospora pubera]KAJ4795950.1 Protein transport protein Sec61 subunit beta [Rhynchospora pubera]